MASSLREEGSDQPTVRFFDHLVVVPSVLDEIAPILGVANEIEYDNPRAEFVHTRKLTGWTPTSSGCGVRQFKTALLQRLDRENDSTLMGRDAKSDAREMQSFYLYYYKKCTQALQNAIEKADCAQLTKACQTASVLFEVLIAVNQTQSVEADREIMETHNKVPEKTVTYVPSLGAYSANQALEEKIQALEKKYHALEKKNQDIGNTVQWHDGILKHLLISVRDGDIFFNNDELFSPRGRSEVDDVPSGKVTRNES